MEGWIARVPVVHSCRFVCSVARHCSEQLPAQKIPVVNIHADHMVGNLLINQRWFEEAI